MKADGSHVALGSLGQLLQTFLIHTFTFESQIRMCDAHRSDLIVSMHTWV